MHCPLCGTKMNIHEPPKPPEIDWGLDGKELDRAIKIAQNMEECKRYTCTCPKGCFMEDFPLYYHYPTNLKGAPMDSWSLSWIK
jgi:hypothetical protein